MAEQKVLKKYLKPNFCAVLRLLRRCETWQYQRFV